ncbi:MAG: hypothetical protein FJZ56_00175 [Chlamydiae bacterium]|nr:hypothetical protein [Chlamydiota bacterium]
MIDVSHKWNSSFKPLILGFIAAVILTIFSYLASSMLLIATLAVIECVVLLVTFLGLGLEAKPRWNLLAFFFMLAVTIILIGGSVWIMNHLNYNMMPMDMQMHKQMKGSL